MVGKLSHLDEAGRARMVDISEKPESERWALARGRVRFSQTAYATLRRDGSEKGDILRTAEIAGVMAAKKTADLIPLCHPLPLAVVRVAATHNDQERAIDVSAEAKTTGRTGVEMEALTAASVACLTIYDMAKSLDKTMTIEVELVEKSGGASGPFKRGPDADGR